MNDDQLAAIGCHWRALFDSLVGWDPDRIGEFIKRFLPGLRKFPIEEFAKYGGFAETPLAYLFKNAEKRVRDKELFSQYCLFVGLVSEILGAGEEESYSIGIDLTSRISAAKQLLQRTGFVVTDESIRDPENWSVFYGALSRLEEVQMEMVEGGSLIPERFESHEAFYQESRNRQVQALLDSPLVVWKDYCVWLSLK